MSGTRPNISSLKPSDIIPPIVRGVRWWCVGSIAASIIAPIATLYVYSSWAFSHYEETANRYETSLSRLVEEMGRTMDANTRALEVSIKANTRQISLLREESKATGTVAGGHMTPAFSLDDLKGAFKEAIDEGLIRIDQRAN